MEPSSSVQYGSISYRKKTIILLSFTAAIGGFLFGYDTGVISGAMIQLRQTFKLSYPYQEAVVSITIASAAISAFVSGPLNEKYGRRFVIILSSLFFAFGAVAMAAASNVFFLIFGRFIVGLGIGLASMTVPMYIAECAPIELRGQMISMYQILITLGQLIASVVDALFYSDSANGWRYMLGLGVVAPVLQFLLIFLIFESPRWLVSKGRIVEATAVLRNIYTKDEDALSVLSDMQVSKSIGRKNSNHEHSDNEISQRNSPLIQPPGSMSSQPNFGCVLFRMLREPSSRTCLLVGCGLQLFQQLAGINTVMYYSATIISMAGIGLGDSHKNASLSVWLSTLVATALFLFSLSSLYLINSVSRRKLLLFSIMGVIISMGLLATSFQLTDINTPVVRRVEAAPVELPASLNPAEARACIARQTCSSCISSHTCGFCFQTDDQKRIGNASCVLSAGLFASYSAYGRCSNGSSAPNMVFAFDYCPSDYAWLSVAGLVLYLACFAPGLGPLPWIINAELYPSWARSTGVAAATTVNWMTNLVVSLTFLSLTDLLTRPGTFWLYAAFSAVGFMLLAKFVPETRDRSIDMSDSAGFVPFA